ncbi:MAG: trimethylamine methyltransferase family protein [Desulfobacula sp.]|jgi:trimethylamine--corrinoid protein Co-methyltransferase|nr:trimethylamine methyltransferase family protein [Desulfobacula sp.]
MIDNSRVSFFSDDDIELMKDKVFTLLSTRGFKVEHPKVLKLLDSAGADVDLNTGIVCLPKSFVEEKLELAPREFTIGARNRENRLKIPKPDGTYYVRTGTGAQTIIDPGTDEFRQVTLSDVISLAGIADTLENVNLFSVPTPSDVPALSADVHAVSAALQHIHKNVWIQPYGEKSVEYLTLLTQVASGGEPETKENPAASIISCAFSPLELKFMDAEIILQAAVKGLPIFACSLPSAGATAPITMPGVAILSAAETLSILITAQVIHPGAPVIPTPLIYALDMANGRTMQSSPEAAQGGALVNQFIKKAFNLPTNATGCGCDAPWHGGQSMIERTIHTMLIGVSGVDVLGNAANLEAATTISPVQLVIDDEINGMVQKILSKPVVNEDTMAWDLLSRAEPGMQFLSCDHTFKHCREGFKTKSFTRKTGETWSNEGKKDLLERARERYFHLLEAKQETTMSEDQIKEMAAIVKKADDAIMGT